MANAANYYWCAMKAILHSKKEELGFFGAYLEDRISYAFELNLASNLPTSIDELLEIGENIELKDIEKLLKKRAKEWKKWIKPQRNLKSSLYLTGIVQIKTVKGSRC